MINKEMAMNQIKEITKNYDKDYTKIHISKESLNISEVVDAFGTNMFDGFKDKEGWLLFVDPIIIANWSHRCEYYFIVLEDEVISNTNGAWFPSSEIEMEEIIN